MNGVAPTVEQRPRAAPGQSTDTGTDGSTPVRSVGASRHGYTYDPQGHIRVGRLRLARAWMEAGGIYQAVQAYADMLDCCGGTYAADAAVEDLLDLAHVLEQRGQFYAALAILKKIDGSIHA